MSVFTSMVTETIAIPHDPGQSVTIRKLAPKHLDEAQQVNQKQSIEMLRDLGGAAFLSELNGLSKESVAGAVQADPLMLFHRPTLIHRAVIASTYDRDLSRLDVAEDLDDETQDVIARAVLRLARPALFEGAEAEQKKGSPVSIVR